MTAPVITPGPDELAYYNVVIAGYPTTVQLTYTEAKARGLYTGAIALPWKIRFAILEFTVHQLEALMTEALSAQAKLDADVAALNEGLGNVETEIAALKAAAPPELDFTALDAAVGRLQADTNVVESTEVPAPPVTP
jgi:hypothetical protein